jgi:CRISPR-associated endonuclease/helicase Cas3
MEKENSSFTSVLAKPDEALSVHTHNAIQFLKQVINWQSHSISRVCKLLSIDRDEIIARLFAMVYLHDIGKCCYSFQKHIRSNDKKSRAFPHPLLSLPFVIGSTRPLKIRGLDEYFEALAVMSHHTPFYDDLYSQYVEAKPEIQYDTDPFGLHLKEYALRFYHYLPEQYRQTFDKQYPFELLAPSMDLTFGSILSRIKQTIQREDSPKELRNIHSLFVSAMHYSDWLASGKTFYKYSEELLSSRLDLYVLQNTSFKNWYDIQREARTVTGNLMLSAPTGKGKTEAGLWWANSNLNSGKVLYLLPTRVTVNAMYDRLKSILGNTTGISHGTSVLRIAEDEKWNNPNIMIKRLIFSTFMTPTTVATVDQLLLSQFNWRHWEMVDQNSSNAAIIFDEIHSYDFYTLALITEIVSVLAKRGTRFAFLSATLPSYIKEHFTRLFQKMNLGINMISDKEFKLLARHYIKFLNQDIHNASDSIIKEYKNNKKVLVILNTVDAAINFYHSIKEQFNSQHLDSRNLLLYHSRFIEKHRGQKEAKIKCAINNKEGFVAITTQVVEVSLDIDYDILFTQLAPLDAMVQRFGRINRKGAKPISELNVLVYKNGYKDELVYGEDNLKNAKEITEMYLNDKKPSEQELTQLIDLQYPRESTLHTFKKEWQNVRSDLTMLQKELWYIQSLLLGDRENALYKIARTRQEKIPDIEIIPYIYKDEVEHLEHKLEAMSYVVRVPLYRFIQCIIPKTDDSVWTYANIEYNEEEGASGCINSGGSGVI